MEPNKKNKDKVTEKNIGMDLPKIYLNLNSQDNQKNGSYIVLIISGNIFLLD